MHNNLTIPLDSSAYDFKVMLEEKKPKSWLNSVSAFANGLGGSLFFGIDNDGTVKGLNGIQHITEAISSKIRDFMDPQPEVVMVPHRINDLEVLQLKVNSGNYTSYYYVGDNVGNLSEIKISERQQNILNLIKKSPTITSKQMSETLSVSQRTIERDLLAMKRWEF